MPKKENFLLQIDECLDLLLELAEKLKMESEQDISHDEIGEWQKEEKRLLDRLGKLDKEYQLKENKNKADEPLIKQIQEKIKTFQQLNIRFFENIAASQQGLLHFKFEKKKPSR